MSLIPQDQHLFLLDSMALIYRAHYALINAPRYTSGGLCTSAVFGVTNTILELRKRKEMTHMAAAMDTREPTQRHQVFPEYKANREEMPEDLSVQIPYVIQLFEAFQIPVLTKPGFEADDIIGTLSKQAAQNGMLTWMVTPDKDLQQLVSRDVSVFKPGRRGGQFELLGVPEVCERWKVERPEQLIDILALMGDASDNVPGVPGIGEKTAQKLIAQFGSLENLLANASQLKGKQRERIETYADQARLSRQLVTISLDVNHEWEWDRMAVHEIDQPALKKIFTELEFETLGKRLFGADFSVSSAQAASARDRREKEIQRSLFDDPEDERNLGNVPHEYIIVRTPDERKSLLKMILSQKAVCFDTETTGLDAREATPLGFSVCFEAHHAFYIVCPDDEAGAVAVFEEFRSFFEHDAIEKIGHNLKYDLTLLRWHGIEVRGPLFDTMLAHTMKEPEMNHGLDYLAQLYLAYHPIPISVLIGEKGKEHRSMRDVPVGQLADYACEDADVTYQVADVLRKTLEESGVTQVCNDVECPLVPVLVDMEYQGIRLDTQALDDCSARLSVEIDSLRARIFEHAGREFNIDSPKQLGVVLYEDLKLDDRPKKTPTGQYSTREAELLRLANVHPIVQDVLDYRNAVKLKSVYVDQLPAAVNPRTGRLHTHYSQAWTSTGRMQSNNPNLQTIPVRKERGREIRAAFVPRSQEFLLLAADYSQIELRIMAELSGDEGMLTAFENGMDIHVVTASKVYKVNPEHVSREMRDKAKTVNFGIIYGISAFGLQQRLNIPRSEAQELIDNYFEKYPGVRSYIDRTIEFARAHGYVQTRTGRRRYLRDINSKNHTRRQASERLAMNSPIQGTAADMLKLAMINIFRDLRDGGYRTKMLLTVHDEIVFDMHHEEQQSVIPVIEHNMRTAMPMRVPIEVEMGVGANWLEAH